LKYSTALAYSSSKTAGCIGLFTGPHQRFASDSDPSFLTVHLSAGERPVNLPVSTVNVSPYSAFATAPSAFACSCAKSSGYVRFLKTVVGPVTPRTSIPTLAHASLPTSVWLTLYVSSNKSSAALSTSAAVENQLMNGRCGASSFERPTADMASGRCCASAERWSERDALREWRASVAARMRARAVARPMVMVWMLSS
jgi:hypothetical protein